MEKTIIMSNIHVTKIIVFQNYINIHFSIFHYNNFRIHLQRSQHKYRKIVNFHQHRAQEYNIIQLFYFSFIAQSQTQSLYEKIQLAMYITCISSKPFSYFPKYFELRVIRKRRTMTICGRRSFGFLFYFGFSIFVCCAAISSCRKSGFNVILIVQNYGKSIHEIVREEWENGKWRKFKRVYNKTSRLFYLMGES